MMSCVVHRLVVTMESANYVWSSQGAAFNRSSHPPSSSSGAPCTKEIVFVKCLPLSLSLSPPLSHLTFTLLWSFRTAETENFGNSTGPIIFRKLRGHVLINLDWDVCKLRGRHSYNSLLLRSLPSQLFIHWRIRPFHRRKQPALAPATSAESNIDNQLQALLTLLSLLTALGVPLMKVKMPQNYL